MYARSTTLIADQSRIDEAIGYIRDEVWPAVRELQGCLGLSMLVDRDTGRCIATTSWETAEAMHDSATAVRSLRDQAMRIAGGAAPTVEEWEIASMHRMHATHPGTAVRTAWSRVPSPHIDRALDFYKSDLLPHIEQLEGFASASLLVDRATGRAVTSVAYDSREAMERTRDQADYLRARSTQEANVEFLDVAELELAIAHLHVPELV